MNPLNATGHLTLLYVDWCIYELNPLVNNISVCMCFSTHFEQIAFSLQALGYWG